AAAALAVAAHARRPPLRLRRTRDTAPTARRAGRNRTRGTTPPERRPPQPVPLGSGRPRRRSSAQRPDASAIVTPARAPRPTPTRPRRRASDPLSKPSREVTRPPRSGRAVILRSSELLQRIHQPVDVLARV